MINRQDRGVLLSVSRAAALLGVTERSVRARVMRRTLPFRKVGSRVMFVASELELFLGSLPGCDAAEAARNLELRHGTD